jgi:hypothetical protein
MMGVGCSSGGGLSAGEQRLGTVQDSSTSWRPRKPVARKIQAESEEQQKMLDEKLETLIKKRYLRPMRHGEKIHVSIPYMTIDKGTKDIRVVWSNTETGVNGSIFCLRMFLPNGDSMYRRLPPSGWMGDMDGGEMFKNFMLHPDEIPLHGVKILEKLWKKLGLEANVLVWERMLFGDRPAPLYASRMFLQAIEMAKQSRYDETTSAFCWDHI